MNKQNFILKGGGQIDSSFDMNLINYVVMVYNFHFYINIFLLAAMSVERFVAVWKSIRCQRYQFNVSYKYFYKLTAIVKRIIS